MFLRFASIEQPAYSPLTSTFHWETNQPTRVACPCWTLTMCEAAWALFQKTQHVIYKLRFCNLHLNCFFVIYIFVIYKITCVLPVHTCCTRVRFTFARRCRHIDKLQITNYIPERSSLPELPPEYVNINRNYSITEPISPGPHGLLDRVCHVHRDSRGACNAP